MPFSLVNADISFWQENPGDWRLRLRGQPARTDVSLDLADTGIVRLEATLKRAPQLRQMPIHLEMEWREAQLGKDLGKYSFREWTIPFTPAKAGKYALKVKATNRIGQSQPTEPLWNPAGYMRNVVETVNITAA